MAELVCERYAVSLFDAALEDGAKDEILQQITELAALFKENREYLKLFTSPVIAVEKKHELISQLLSNRVHGYLLNFSRVLIDNNRFSEFCNIAEKYAALSDKHDGILRVEAITALPLSEELKQKLSLKLSNSSGKKVVLTNSVDESVLGGVKLRYNQTEIDGTVKTRLTEMKSQIKEQSI